MTSLFTGDAVLIDADRRFEGRDAIRSGFAEPEVAGYTIGAGGTNVPPLHCISGS
ncbi:hypothetical protein ACFTZB_15670 [Rhodococcus sp. NPDC057014]|uniref:hypothetical protein n=1 Tax=Rhodococcus sp. NPDC057014 TaxID=3346000 RepID=UPI003644CA61